MKKLLSIAAVLSAPLVSQAGLETYTTTVNTLIPDGSLAGMASVLNVSGLDGQSISDLTLNLNVSGTYNGDLYAYVQHDGQTVVLLNRVGVSPSDSSGYADQGMNVTFVDGAPNIHYYQNTLGNPSGVISPLTGDWAPDGRAVSPLAVTGAETPTETLSSLFSTDPDGQWTFFIADVSGGDLNTLNSWSLSLTTVPEPADFGLAAGIGLLLVSVAKGAQRRSALKA